MNNQVKTEDDASKKRQKTKEIESIDLLTPVKKSDIQMQNLKDSNVSVSTSVDNEET